MEEKPAFRKAKIAKYSADQPAEVKTLKQITLEEVSELVCFNQHYYDLAHNGVLPLDLKNELLE